METGNHDEHAGRVYERKTMWMAVSRSILKERKEQVYVLTKRKHVRYICVMFRFLSSKVFPLLTTCVQVQIGLTTRVLYYSQVL
jgi:hypothetical protein